MTTPRILPLIGVAVVGVLAINLMGGARDLPRMMSAARAYAEGVTAPVGKAAKGGKGAKADASAADGAPPIAAAPSISTPAPSPAAVCAASAAELAKAAGLSPGESQVLQNLQARRSQIDAQGKDLDAQTQLLAAAELKVDAKLKAMTDLKGQIEALLGQADQKTQGEVDRLTVVYSKMKPADAAAVMAQLDDKVRVPIAAQMKPAILSAVLAKMQPADAKKLTELLAHRFAPIQQLADAAKAQPPAAAPPPPATPPSKDKKAAAAQTAGADPDDANVGEVKPKPKAKPHPKPIARRAPVKKPAAKKPVDEAKASSGPHPYSEVKDAPAKPADKPAAAATPPAKT